MIEHLRALAVFAQVADSGSFRAAARVLSVSPSVVSHHIHELEQRLATPLLYRTTRSLALTPDGARLATFARAMVAAAVTGLDEVTGRGTTSTGTLRITAPAFLAETTLSRDLAAFADQHPNVRLVVSFSDAPRDLLRDGLDLALRFGKLVDSTHRTRKLAVMRRRLVAAPAYAVRHPRARTPDDLAAWDFIQLSSRPPEVELTTSGKRKPVVVAFRPKVQVDSAVAMREFALAGAGIAALPDVIVRAELASDRLVEPLPRWQPASVGVYAMWPSSAQRPSLTVAFVDFISARIAAMFAAS